MTCFDPKTSRNHAFWLKNGPKWPCFTPKIRHFRKNTLYHQPCSYSSFCPFFLNQCFSQTLNFQPAKCSENKFAGRCGHRCLNSMFISVDWNEDLRIRARTCGMFFERQLTRKTIILSLQLSFGIFNENVMGVNLRGLFILWNSILQKFNRYRL